MREGLIFFLGRNIGWGDIPLKLEFPYLFYLCGDKKCLVRNCWEGHGCNISFQRVLGNEDTLEWERSMEILEDCRLNEEEDKFV
jgi:hypothetical protein